MKRTPKNLISGILFICLSCLPLITFAQNKLKAVSPKTVAKGQNLFNDSIRKITKKFNVLLIDLDKESRKVSDKKNLFFSDGIHFNNHGSKWAADVISNSFLKYPELTFEVKKLNQSCPPLFFGKNNFVDAPLSIDIFPGM